MLLSVVISWAFPCPSFFENLPPKKANGAPKARSKWMCLTEVIKWEFEICVFSGIGQCYGKNIKHPFCASWAHKFLPEQ
jgi:hypothetical protein